MRVYRILAGVTALLIAFSLANRAGSEPPVDASKDGWCGEYTVFNGGGGSGRRVTIKKEGDHYRIIGLRKYAEEYKFVEVKPFVLERASGGEWIRRGTLRFENDTVSRPVLEVILGYEMFHLIGSPSAVADKKPEEEKPTPPEKQIEAKLREVRKQLEALRKEEQELEKLLQRPQPKEPQPIKMEKTWYGEVKLDLKNVAPQNHCISNKEDWAKLWKAYRGDEKLPEVDFDKQLVVVAVNAPNLFSTRLTVDDQGDLKIGISPIFAFVRDGKIAYEFALIRREGIKTIEGQPLVLPSVARPTPQVQELQAEIKALREQLQRVEKLVSEIEKRKQE